MLKTQRFPMPGQGAKARVGSTVRRVQRLQGMPLAHRVLGIDPGLNITGYGLLDVDKAQGATPRFVEGGTLRARDTDSLPKRIQTLYDGLSEILREHSPDVVVIEELFSTYAHPRSALLMAHVRGAFMLAAQQQNIPVHGFTPNEVKQVISGNGHATKSQMQMAIKARLKLNFVPNPPDVADALSIALCYILRQNSLRQ